MKRFSEFLVKKRHVILAVMLLIAVVCGLVSHKVAVTSDITKYLPDHSNMKIGLDLMDKEFPATDSGDIRVMFNGLEDTQKQDVLQKLQAIQYVDSVDYKTDSPEYNNLEHTLFVVKFKHSYDSSEAAAVEKSISTGFNGYDMIYHVDKDTSELSPAILLLALIILMIVLFLMCSSWLEPILLLGTIGAAVLMNMGTNVLLGTISETTKSISSILQLVLSMDYAMVLLNRYRQEQVLDSDSKTAMKNALANAFHAIVGSALATMVGLLMLCFMSFKIGMDLGLVLSKGVLFSMLCIITIFPALLIIFDKAVKKTSKKVLPIKMDAISKFSNKYRFAVTGAFVVIFIGAYLISSQTKMAYVLEGKDPTTKYFPKNSQVVIVYKNSDEEYAAKLADEYAGNSNVKNVAGYSSTLGKAYTDQELSDKLADIGSGSTINLNPAVLKIIYYNYYRGNTVGSISVSNFINFIADNAMTNEALADKLGRGLMDKIESIKKFAVRDKLLQPMNAKEISEFFGMKQEEVTQLFMYYYSLNGEMDTGSMTLSQFAEFVGKDVASNKQYAAMLDQNTLTMINQLKVFTDKEAVTKPLTSTELSAAIGIDESSVKLLMVYYYAAQEGFNEGTMMVPQFVNLLTQDVASDSMFSSSFDSTTLAKMNSLSLYTNIKMIQKQMTASELASALHMDSAMVESIIRMHSAAGGASADSTMSMQEFMDFLVSNVLTNQQYAPQFDAATAGHLKFLQNIMEVTTSGKMLTSGEMATMFGMKPAMVKMLYTYNMAEHGDTSSWKLSLQSTVDFIVKDLSSNSTFSSRFSGDSLNKLVMLEKLINGTVTGKSYSTEGLSKLLGMDSKKTDQLYLLYHSKYGDTSDWKMSIQEFVNFMVSNVITSKNISSGFNADTVSELESAKTMIDAVVSGKAYTAKELTGIFGSISDKLDEKTMDLMYMYYFSTIDSNPSWKLSINDLFSYLDNSILKDPRFDSFIDNAMRLKIGDMKTKMDEGVKQFTGPEYSRMILSVSLQEGSDESYAFIKELTQKCNSAFSGEYYLIGSEPMAYEMSQTFESEHRFISLLTAIAIFIIVALTFRSFLIPLILVLIIQGGVYLTISLTGLQGNSIYYLAMLIVECILMGATIDYGILYASYYKEFRTTMSRGEALIAASNGSIHTILTSGLIMILVTGIVGYAFKNPTVGQICLTIAKGAFCTVILIVFILQGVIATFDKLINRGKNTYDGKADVEMSGASLMKKDAGTCQR